MEGQVRPGGLENAGKIFRTAVLIRSSRLLGSDEMKIEAPGGDRSLVAKRRWTFRLDHALGTLVEIPTAALVLLVASSLLLHSFVRVLDTSLGFTPNQLARVRVDPPARLPDLASYGAYYDEVLRRTRAIPGVESASLSDMLTNRHFRQTVGARRMIGTRQHGFDAVFACDVEDRLRIRCDQHVLRGQRSRSLSPGRRTSRPRRVPSRPPPASARGK